MAFTSGDIVRIVVDQTYDSQQCLNVFYYKMNSGFPALITPAELGQLFWDKVQLEWRTLVSNNVTFNRVVVENLDGDLDFGEYTIPDDEDTGTGTGESLASFAAFAIQLNRTNRLVRQGAKRIVGVPEAAVANYSVLTPTAQDELQELADVFADDVNNGLVIVANPVIVGFPNATRPTRVDVAIDTATAKTQISTQNTRKRGSGS